MMNSTGCWNFLLIPYSFYVLFKTKVQLGHINDAEKILKKNQQYFNTCFQRDLIHFCNPIIQFEKGKYGESLNSLYSINISRKSPIYLDARKLEIQIFYDKKKFNVVESKINSFKTLLSRENDYTKSRKRFYLDFVNILFRLIRSDDSKREKLRKTALEKMPFEGDQWLLKQIDSL